MSLGAILQESKGEELVKVCCLSYKRPNAVTVLKLVDNLLLCVPQSQYKDYRKN